MGNRGEPTEVTPTFVVVLPQAYKRAWWNRVLLVENISMKILVDGDRYRTMGRNEREPPHAQRIVLPAFGRLWQAYVEAETGRVTILEQAIHAGKNPMEELESLMQDVKEEIRQQPAEVGSALVEFMRASDWLEVLIKYLRTPLVHDQRILLRLDDSVGPKLVSEQFGRYTHTWASIIVEAAFGRFLPQDELATLATQIAMGAMRDFVKEWVVVAEECHNVHVSDDARWRRKLRVALLRCLLHRFKAIWEYQTTLNDRLGPPRQGFEQYDNVLRHIEADVSTHGGTLKQRAEDLGVPLGDVYDCLRRKKYRDKR